MFQAPLTLSKLYKQMYLLVNLLIKLSMLQWRKGSRPLEIYSRFLGWRAAPVKNYWYQARSQGGNGGNFPSNSKSSTNNFLG